MNRPEVWLRGPVDAILVESMPIAHALLQAEEDIEQVTKDVTSSELWLSPGGAASIGFHIRHVAGSLDRLFTYARGERLNDKQKSWLVSEKNPVQLDLNLDDLKKDFSIIVAAALAQLRSTPANMLYEPRYVGRAKLPSTVSGLLFHAAEHTTRHVGQIITTLKVIRGLE